MKTALRFVVVLVCVMALSALAGCAFIQGLIGMASGGTPTAEDAAAVQAGIKAFVGLLSGDYAGALYWGAAACGGSLYAGGKATAAAGSGVKKVLEKRKAKKAAVDKAAVDA